MIALYAFFSWTSFSRSLISWSYYTTSVSCCPSPSFTPWTCSKPTPSMVSPASILLIFIRKVLLRIIWSNYLIITKSRSTSNPRSSAAIISHYLCYFKTPNKNDVFDSYYHLIDPKLLVLLVCALRHGDHELWVFFWRVRVVNEAVAERIIKHNRERENLTVSNRCQFGDYRLECLWVDRVALPEGISLVEVLNYLGE